VRVIKDSAVFDDHKVEELKIRECTVQVAERAACVQDELAPGCPETGEDSKSMRIDAAIGGDGFVVVGGKRLYVVQNSVQS
jgi:hypothetical protein